ncbi:transcription factor bHLH35-like [Olea europaea var. sylvestris]|uniref:transcription factor bHLH35-like n=1 Tax=Olea europaea var. sylvestris TaxID=158386 RepID=UPI000C1D1BB8|nr:transcription factor bHLH35-like [Olea europaea var. sylvestris]
MENISDEYILDWETNTFLQAEELQPSYLDEAIPTHNDSSSQDGTQSSLMANKSIVSERNRRKKLNERLYALRSVAPNITKMHKESIVKDAIDYIQKLHEEERKIQAEISDLESAGSSSKSTISEFDHEETFSSNPKRVTSESFYDSGGSRSSPIEVLEFRVSSMGEKTVVVSLTCSKRSNTMVKLCEMFESLNLEIISENITAFSDRVLKTVFVQADEKEKDLLKIKIETAIAALNAP